MRCPHCDQENLPESQYCSHCGEKLLEPGSLDATMSFRMAGDALEEEKLIDLEQLSADGPLLVVVKGRRIGQTFSLEGTEVSIGRDPHSDIFLDDITVSRKHAKIMLSGTEALISDVGSLNGTYVNRERIDRSSLSHKDELQIGKFKMVFIAQRPKNGGDGV